MKLIVGLGNPGADYELTRHNVGFMAIDQIEMRDRLTFKSAHQGLVAKLNDIIYLKPLTYMNLSGQSVQATCRFYKIEPQNVCVLHDELDLPFGTLRLKVGGGHGGHNGLRSLTASLGSDQFSRIRIGIGRPKEASGSVSDFVLSQFNAPEMRQLPHILKYVEDAIDAFTSDQAGKFQSLMNTYNKKDFIIT